MNNELSSFLKQHYLVICLIMFSLVSLAARWYYLGNSSLSSDDRLWKLGIYVETTSASSLRVFPPIDTANIRTIQRNIVHPGFRIKNEGSAKTQRSIFAKATEKGQQFLSVEFLLHVSQVPFLSQPGAGKTVVLDTPRRESYLVNNDMLQLTSNQVQDRLAKLMSGTLNQEQLVDVIFRSLKKIPLVTGKDELNVPVVLSKNRATVLDRSLAMVALCRAAGIPARIVTGIFLKEDINPQLHYWVDVYQNERWSAYDLHFGYEQSVPIHYLPIRRNSLDIVQVNKGSLEKVELDIEQEFDYPYQGKIKGRNIFSLFDLTRLPIDTRNQLEKLLLLPLGALITVICRHFGGMRSYGVFTPTLLALAIIYNDVVTTIVVFFVICVLAIAGRRLFPASITRVPRLSIIFTLIAIILAMSVSIMDFININQEGGVILLPIIILTSLVDRLYRTIEDRGIDIAMRRLFWTIIIAVLCVPVFQQETLGQILLQYPEIHFSTLALFVMFSRYKGRQLLEITWLKYLAEPEKEIKVKKKH